MQISTGQGDLGKTKLGDGTELSKGHVWIEVLGSLDECNAQLGICRSVLQLSLAGLPTKSDPDSDSGTGEPNKLAEKREMLGEILEHLSEVQRTFFTIGAVVAQSRRAVFPKEKLRCIEEWIERAEARLPKMTHFILPGGSIAGAHLHNARTVCRRLECCYNRYLELPTRPNHLDDHPTHQDGLIRVYLNRLSDYLFCLARLTNSASDCPEILWHPE